MVSMYNEKWNYNNNLNRFYNGCNYITENPEQCDEYLDDVLKLKKNCELFLTKIEEKDCFNWGGAAICDSCGEFMEDEVYLIFVLGQAFCKKNVLTIG